MIVKHNTTNKMYVKLGSAIVGKDKVHVLIKAANGSYFASEESEPNTLAIPIAEFEEQYSNQRI